MAEIKKITLVGNPNVGKSTVFNSLTGLKQHTGNWTGKTVSSAKGYFTYKDEKYEIIDIPGTYSLNPQSEDEEIARDFICFSETQATVIVCDAMSLERNLLMALQTIEAKDNIILCVNLLDEAKKKNIKINLDMLEKQLGVCVVGTSARNGQGIDKLLEKIKIATSDNTYLSNKFEYEKDIQIPINIVSEALEMIDCKGVKKRFIAIKLLENKRDFINKLEQYLGVEFYKNDKISIAIKNAKAYLDRENINKEKFEEKIYFNINNICKKICDNIYHIEKLDYYEKDLKLDKILTSKKYGIPIMIFLLSLIFWITITGANYPSMLLSETLFSFEENLYNIFSFLKFPEWLSSLLVDGVYKVVCWVVSVMLPPMAIFFPLFTLMEDFGYLPRVAFNLDNIFKKCNACGKQALTMAMGFGCNACAVTGCRIINSPRERLIAILTNNFVPCNGRLCLQIKRKIACISCHKII